MEERLAFYRSMEEMAKDDDARQEAARIARSFERAIQDAKAEAKKEQERVSTLLRSELHLVLDSRKLIIRRNFVSPRLSCPARQSTKHQAGSSIFPFQGSRQYSTS
jgi:hypothetical protein